MRQLTETQQKIYDFVAAQHGTQIRKYTGEPYVLHCLEVAELVYKCTQAQDLWIIALGHDLFEDTNCSHFDLIKFLIEEINMELDDALWIKRGIMHLTDEYTSTKYPDMNRQERKLEEAIKLADTLPQIQSIKYADIISNTRSIVTYDSKFALTYLPEKVQLLHYMREGNINLYIQACAEVYEGLISVGLLENYKFSV